MRLRDHDRRRLTGHVRRRRACSSLRGGDSRRRPQDDLQIRAGVHAGKVERQAGNVRGLAVHAATRISALAQPGEVLASPPAVALFEGSDLELEDAGEHELKGLTGPSTGVPLGGTRKPPDGDPRPSLVGTLSAYRCAASGERGSADAGVACSAAVQAEQPVSLTLAVANSLANMN